MRAIYFFAKANLKNAVEYRGPILVWLMESLLALLGFGFFWIASRLKQDSPYSQSDLVTYFFLGMLAGHLCRFYVYTPIQEEIQNGTVNFTLTKPVSYLWAWVGRSLGWKIVSGLLWVSLMFPFYFLFREHLNLSPQNSLFLYLITLVFSAVISYLISFCMGITAFWLTEVRALDGFFWILFFFFGGRVVPPEFFPGFLRFLIEILPFRYMFAFPLEVYLGKLTSPDLLKGFLVGSGWCLGLLILTKIVWRRGVKAYGAFGG